MGIDVERRMNIVMMACDPFSRAMPVRTFAPGQKSERRMRQFMTAQQKRTPHAVLSVHNTPHATVRPVTMTKTGVASDGI